MLTSSIKPSTPELHKKWSIHEARWLSLLQYVNTLDNRLISDNTKLLPWAKFKKMYYRNRDPDWQLKSPAIITCAIPSSSYRAFNLQLVEIYSSWDSKSPASDGTWHIHTSNKHRPKGRCECNCTDTRIESFYGANTPYQFLVTQNCSSSVRPTKPRLN